MAKRIEIVLTPHGPELKTPLNSTAAPKQPVAPKSPVPLVRRTPSSPLLVLKSPDILPVPRKPPPPGLSPGKDEAPVGSLIGAIRAATSSALRSVQGFHPKKAWETGAGPEWSSSPVTCRPGEDRFREDRFRSLQRIEESAAYKAPKKRDLNGFVRNSLIFGPKSKANHSPLKRSSTHLSESQPYLSFGTLSDPFHLEESPIRPCPPSSKPLQADSNADNPAPSPEVSKRQTPNTPNRSSFKAKLLARALQRTQS